MEITRVGKVPWYFTVVYANPDPTERHNLWRELQGFAMQHNKPWLLAEDFNETRFPWESSSCVETTRRSTCFNHWVEDMNVIEVGFVGSSHTWSRGLAESTRQIARLDRAAWMTHEYFHEFVTGNWKQDEPLISLLCEISKLQAWNKEVAMLWYQESRVQKIKDGDHTKFLFPLKYNSLTMEK
ncbi:Medium-chain specific acyl-CoA dehydrogenase mitochondrial [Bienertia sinuspersici]